MIDNLEQRVTELLQHSNEYIHTVVNGNEFAAGMIIAGLMGTAAYLSRSVPGAIWKFLKRHTTTELSMNSTNEVFHSAMAYFEQQGLSDQARTIRVNNKLDEYGDDEAGKFVKGIGYGDQYFWFKGRILHISVSKENNTVGKEVKEFLTIKKLGRSHKLFDTLIGEIRDVKDENMTSYYSWQTYGEKNHIVDQPKRTIDNVILEPELSDNIKSTIDSFVSKEEWYTDNMIPYQLGMLLYGPPGTGKTTLVRAIAGYMNKDVVLVKDAETLASAAQNCNDAIIVVDEVDTFGTAKRDRDEVGHIGGKDTFTKIMDSVSSSKLASVLTALDGVISNHGRIVIMCTNHHETLDSAMIRPGRIDVKLEIGHLSENTFNQMLDKFFGERDRGSLDLNDNVAPAELQNDVIVGMTEEEIINKYTKGE